MDFAQIKIKKLTEEYLEHQRVLENTFEKLIDKFHQTPEYEDNQDGKQEEYD